MTTQSLNASQLDRYIHCNTNLDAFRYTSRTVYPYYRVFNESNRARTYNKPSPVLCDTALSGWYRFIGAAGSRMADTCVAYKHCATGAPGWLDGGHPTVYEGTVQRKVCFRGRTKCCSWSINISVRNCGDFYVYELKKPPHCNFRYCGNGISSIPGTDLVVYPQNQPLCVFVS